MSEGKTYLGAVCKRGHDDGTGHSLRFRANNACVACHKLAKGQAPRPAPLYAEPAAPLPRGRAGGGDAHQSAVNRSHSHRAWYARNRDRLIERKRARRAQAAAGKGGAGE